MRKLDDYHLPMLQRLSSYSEDTAYEHHELPQLIREIRSLVRHCRRDDPLLPVLRQLRKLAEDAQHRRTALNVIGDYAFP